MSVLGSCFTYFNVNSFQIMFSLSCWLFGTQSSPHLRSALLELTGRRYCSSGTVSVAQSILCGTIVIISHCQHPLKAFKSSCDSFVQNSTINSRSTPFFCELLSFLLQYHLIWIVTRLMRLPKLLSHLISLPMKALINLYPVW